jgi:hypothetical protein
MVASKKVTSKHKRVLAFIRKDERPPGRRSVSRRRGNPGKPGDGQQQSPTSCSFYWFRPVAPPQGIHNMEAEVVEDGDWWRHRLQAGNSRPLAMETL